MKFITVHDVEIGRPTLDFFMRSMKGLTIPDCFEKEVSFYLQFRSFVNWCLLHILYAF